MGVPVEVPRDGFNGTVSTLAEEGSVSETDDAGPTWPQRGTTPTQSIRHAGTLESSYHKWKADAFVAFAPSSEYERVRDILARPTRGGEAWPDRGGVASPLLPALQCGAPHPERPNGRCGLSLTPMRTEGDGYAYTSARCSFGERGHRTSFSPHIERPVLEMVAEAYTPAAMAAVVGAVRARAVIAAGRIAELDRLVAAKNADYERASRLENTAHREENALDIAHWGAQRRIAQEERNLIEQERTELAKSMTDFAPPGGLERHLKIVQEVTRDANSLLVRSTAHQGMTRALLRVLTRAITIRQPAPWLAVLEVEFPNGARSARVALTGRVPCTQPERIVAYHALTSGEDLAATVTRLTQPNDRYGPRLLLTPEKVHAFALLHHFFETVPLRMGPLESVTGIAARVHLPAADVEAAALRGFLGAAGIATDGTLLLAPSEAELEGALDEYASRQVEGREGWASGEAIRMRTLRRDHGLSATAITKTLSLEIPGRAAYDLANRRYIRRSAIPAKLLARANRAAGPAAFRAAARAAIDAAGYGSTSIEDWWPIGTLLTQLRTSARTGSKPNLQLARDKGLVLQIPYRGPHPVPGTRKPGLLVYCPASVAHSGDPVLVRQWFQGKTPRPTPTTSDSPAS